MFLRILLMVKNKIFAAADINSNIQLAIEVVGKAFYALPVVETSVLVKMNVLMISVLNNK